jgi:uncharacterized membrane protein
MSSKAIEEIALVIGVLGALVIAAGSLIIIVAGRSYTGPTEADHRREKWAHLVGGVFVAIGFAGTLWRLFQK